MYSPYINRFLQPDTIIPDLSNPQSWNRFSYVTNRPVNFSDSTGHMQENDDDIKDNDGECDSDDKGCNSLKKEMEGKKKPRPPFGQVIAHDVSGYPPDGDVISLTLVAGAGPWYAHAEIDSVCVHSTSVCVLFRVRGVNQNNWNNLMSPQVSLSLSGGRIVSTELRNNPTVSGIIETFKGEARERRFDCFLH